jgi:formamidopyrimidine-DNA glycosylase
MLDQHGPVAGAGNYLIDETLFAERVHPMTSADSLDSVQWLALWHRCRAIALRSLAGRSELLEDYLAPDGARGDQADRLVCYGRAGRRCVICGSQLTRIRVARRGTTFCPSCQQENTKS